MREQILPHDFHRFDRSSWVIKETAFGYRLWVSLDDLAIARPVLVDAYELAEARFIEHTVREGDLAVDVGANLGFHALHMAKLVGPAGRVLAFEPLGYLGDALSASVAENGFSERVEVRREALSDCAEEAVLRHAPRTANFGGAHLARSATPEIFQTDERVPCVPLDDVLGERRCAFIKMDVEGAESRVVNGARRTLERDRPAILSELHETQLRAVSGCGANDLIAQLRELGYRCLHLRADGTPGDEIATFSSTVPTNVIFLP
ncbi:MAG: FkbM family methyltransferase [Candidatus Eremiobacteraeota bacterium]|nr:FkbM family methyltransferase [Candidatus Eremiobacteraeota bacterium]